MKRSAPTSCTGTGCDWTTGSTAPGALHGRAEPGPSATATGPRRVVVGQRSATGLGHRPVPARPSTRRPRSSLRRRSTAARPPLRGAGPTPDDSGDRPDRDVPERIEHRGDHRRQGHRVPHRPFMDRRPRCLGRAGSAAAGPRRDPGGRPLHAGLPWQHTRGSALLGWVGADAAFVAAQIDGSRTAITGSAVR